MNLVKTIITIIEERAKEIKVASVVWSDKIIRFDQILLGTATEPTIQLLGLTQEIAIDVNELKKNLDNNDDLDYDQYISIEKTLGATIKLHEITSDLFYSALTLEFSNKLGSNETLGFAENFQVYSEIITSDDVQKITVQEAIHNILNQN